MSRIARRLPPCFVAALILAADRTIVAQVDHQRAATYFADVARLCAADAGKLWGVSLCGPMVIADARTRTIATSEPPPDGDRPRLLGLANAPITWGGRRWAMYVWDFVGPADRQKVHELLLHELFHLVQPQLNLMTADGNNEHLDGLEGRYWLQLEWRALAGALRTADDRRALAIRDALAFRAARRAVVPTAGENERRDEIREGLAQYTATVAAAQSSAGAIASALEQVANADKQESFVRTFAYTSGAAYGVLLDGYAPEWRRDVRNSSDLGAMLAAAARLRASDDRDAAASRYGGLELRAAEAKRDQERQTRLAALRQRFVDGPVLIAPAGNGVSDARGATPISGHGTIFFGTYRSTGPWGTLEATTGVLVSSDGATRRVPAPFRTQGNTLTGEGWTVTLTEGWIIRPGLRPGDFQIVREMP